MKKLLTLILGVIVFGSFFLSQTTKAAVFKVPKEEGGNIVIAKDEMVKNLYTAGNVVLIDGNIDKNLYAGGNTVTVNGDVEEGVYAGGSTIIIRGNVGNSVHAGGGNVHIESIIKEDIFLGGGNITLSKNAMINRDAYIGGGTVKINSPINGNVFVGAGEVVINSKINGNLKIEADKVEFGENAEIVNVTYSSPKEAKIDKGAVISGKVDFKIKEKEKTKEKREYAGGLLGLVSIMFIIKILISFVTGLVLIKVFKKLSDKVVTNGLGNYMLNIGIGFGVMIVSPIILLALLISIIGASLALIGTIIYILLLILSCTYGSISLGSLVVKIIGKKKEYVVNWQAVAVGVVMVSLINIVPIIGCLVVFAFTLISLGSLSKMFYQGMVKK